ncbi:MAG TPA: Glu-tRNA(Gln) amidotransferase subunit GatE [Candidatus Acidoferrum sp.]|nr:Glu-tRNA(Gln) amidotransferase subunit GatE [Candidatus Acidoferrum sp.]
MTKNIDYDSVGLKVGIEIHRQLDTERKLFCNCPTTMSDTDPSIRFLRRLRPTQSELGQVDPAALFEFQKGRAVIYESDNRTSCLVEMDEEPPKDLNPEAVEVALTASLLTHAKPVDEIHVMRKIVIDGSNTTGFQRTCVVAMDGWVSVDEKKIPIQQISLEEDAARKTSESGLTVNYRIDRLGIPLIEVSTGPTIASPEETERVAKTIGDILRDTGHVKRGLGTVRQDLNVSIRDGALSEIKGVQELDLLSKVVSYEVSRQLELLKIRDQLISRGVKEAQIVDKFVDVSRLFSNTRSKLIREALGSGGVALAARLPGFSKLLGRELAPGLRLGTEMASRANFWGRVGGIFHTDELPAYGITEEETLSMKRTLGCGELDAAVLVADLEDKAMDALKAVVERAREALLGVPTETRMAVADGTTRYMRPRPGASRMYPETDVPPVEVSQQKLAQVRTGLPPPRELVMQQLLTEYQLNAKLASQLIESDYLDVFRRVSSKGGIAPSFVATVLTENLKSLQREGVPVNRLTPEHLESVFSAVRAGTVAKEAAPSILTWLSKNDNRTVEDAIQELGMRMLSEHELLRIVDRIIEANSSLVEEKGDGAYGKIMGLVMSEVRGSADPAAVTRLIRTRIRDKMRRK